MADEMEQQARALGVGCGVGERAGCVWTGSAPPHPAPRCAAPWPCRVGPTSPLARHHRRSTPDRMQWLAEQSAWWVMGAVGWGGDMARHLGTRSE